MTGKEGYSAEEAQAILAEVRNIENLLRAGQKEKQQLHQSLKLLGEDIRCVMDDEQTTGNTPAAAIDIEKHSTACQTDFGADVSFFSSSMDSSLVFVHLNFTLLQLRLVICQMWSYITFLM